MLALSNVGLISPDSYSYLGLADSMSHGHYSFGVGQDHVFPADLLRPPGYPLFLSAVGATSPKNAFIAGSAECVIAAVFCCLLGLAGARLFGPKVGISACAIFAIEPSSVLYAQRILADGLAALLIGLSLLAFLEYLHTKDIRFAALGGVICGIAILVKPIAVMLLPVLTLSWFVSKPRRVAALALALVCASIVSIPWAVRNYMKYHLFTISEISTVNMYFYTAVFAEHPDLSEAEQTEYVHQVASEHHTPALTHHELVQRTRAAIESHPGIALKQAVIGAVRTAIGPGSETITSILPSRPAHYVIAASLLLIAAIWVAAVIGIFHLGVSNPATILLFISIVFLIIPAASPAGYSRFRIVIIVPLAILAGAATASQRILFPLNEPFRQCDNNEIPAIGTRHEQRI